ncbi:hypothetical protein EYV94_19615 [Puteibacter caeruleilacunae]|nr:hypothetical protein EYV94_19615 [Puteibacter caeruleilacunae]
MKQLKSFLALALLFIATSTIAQIKFTKGYIIDINNNKYSCFIRNNGNQNSGANYSYKIYEKDTPKDIDMKAVKEFGIDNQLRYVRSLIAIDISSDNIRDEKEIQNSAEIEKGFAFLKEVMRGGTTSLLYFFFEGKGYYFYKQGEADAELLVFKKYNVEKESRVVTKIIYDQLFQEQLKQKFPCSINTKTVRYNERSLTNYFKTYFNETNKQFQTNRTDDESTSGELRAKLVLTGNKSSYTINDESRLLSFPFDDQNNMGFGLEVEYLFKFNRNKFGIFAEANYMSYDGTTYATEALESSQASPINIDYKYLEFPIGICYYSHLNAKQDANLFVKFGYAPNTVLSSSKLTMWNDNNEKEMSGSGNMFYGVGFNYRRFSIEFRQYTDRNITQGVHNYGSDYGNTSLRLSFQLVKVRGNQK